MFIREDAGIVDAQPDMYVAAIGTTVAAMLADDPRLDVVLLDLVLTDGTTPTQNIRSPDAIAPVLAFTSGERPRLVREAGRAGVIGMIRKSELPEAIVNAIRTVVRGEVVVTADWAAALDSDATFVTAHLSRGRAGRPAVPDLTPVRDQHTKNRTARDAFGREPGTPGRMTSERFFPAAEAIGSTAPVRTPPPARGGHARRGSVRHLQQPGQLTGQPTVRARPTIDRHHRRQQPSAGEQPHPVRRMQVGRSQ